MKKEKEESKPAEHESKGDGKGKKKLHLHQVRTVQARDGSLVHHHTYKDHADAHYTHPEREAAATSQNPEDAGSHVTDQFAMNQMGGGEPGGAEMAEGGAEPGGMAGGAVPQEV